MAGGDEEMDEDAILEQARLLSLQDNASAAQVPGQAQPS